MEEQQDHRDIKFFTNQEPISILKSCCNYSPLHRHGFLEFSYICKGSAIHILNKTSVNVKTGDYFTIDYGEIHGFIPDKFNDFEIINILFDPSFISKSLTNCKGFSELISNVGININYYLLKNTPTSVMYHDDSGEIFSIVDKMYREFNEKKPRYLELIRCYLIELIIITLRKILKTNESIQVDDKIINNIIEFITTNHGQEITLKSIGEKFGYSPSYLSALFSKKTGITFKSYLQNIRVSHACELLSNTSSVMEEVASACGYGDLKFFRTVFKEKMNMSPSEFRRMSQKNPILH